MIDLLQNTVDGLMIGSSYGLLALGFTLIFGVMRRLNLSYGPSIMIGAYLGTILSSDRTSEEKFPELLVRANTGLGAEKATPH